MTFSTQILVVLVIGRVVEKHYQDLGGERHQYGISTIVAQTSFQGETSVGITNCHLLLPQLQHLQYKCPNPISSSGIFPQNPAMKSLKTTTGN